MNSDLSGSCETVLTNGNGFDVEDMAHEDAIFEDTSLSPTSAPCRLSELTILETALLYGFRQLPTDLARMNLFEVIENSLKNKVESRV